MAARSRKPLTCRINEIGIGERTARPRRAVASCQSGTPILDRNLIKRARTFDMAVPKNCCSGAIRRRSGAKPMLLRQNLP
jgi:hypothetical protein